MKRLVVLTGPASAAKSEWARVWVAKKPLHRVHAYTEAEAMLRLSQGFGVVFETSRDFALLSLDLQRRVTQHRHFKT